MTVAEIRAGLANALEQVDNVTVYGRLQGRPALPAIVVGWPQEWDLHSAQGGPQDYVIPIEVLVGFADPESADETLEELLVGSGNLVEALLDDPTLGGACDSLDPTNVANVGVVKLIDDAQAIAATVLVTVYA